MNSPLMPIFFDHAKEEQQCIGVWAQHLPDLNSWIADLRNHANVEVIAQFEPLNKQISDFLVSESFRRINNSFVSLGPKLSLSGGVFCMREGFWSPAEERTDPSSPVRFELFNVGDANAIRWIGTSRTSPKPRTPPPEVKRLIPADLARQQEILKYWLAYTQNGSDLGIARPGRWIHRFEFREAEKMSVLPLAKRLEHDGYLPLEAGWIRPSARLNSNAFEVVVCRDCMYDDSSVVKAFLALESLAKQFNSSYGMLFKPLPIPTNAKQKTFVKCPQCFGQGTLECDRCNNGRVRIMPAGVYESCRICDGSGRKDCSCEGCGAAAVDKK